MAFFSTPQIFLFVESLEMNWKDWSQKLEDKNYSFLAGQPSTTSFAITCTGVVTLRRDILVVIHLFVTHHFCCGQDYTQEYAQAHVRWLLPQQCQLWKYSGKAKGAALSVKPSASSCPLTLFLYQGLPTEQAENQGTFPGEVASFLVEFQTVPIVVEIIQRILKYTEGFMGLTLLYELTWRDVIFVLGQTLTPDSRTQILGEAQEIQPVHPKGDKSWVFIGRTDAEAEAPILWPPHAKS